MAHDARKLNAVSERNDFVEAMHPKVPDLTFNARGNPDPRLVRLARLLGKQIARQNFEAQTARQELEGS